MKDCQTLNPINSPTLIPNFLIKTYLNNVVFLLHGGRGMQLWMEIYNNMMYVVLQALEYKESVILQLKLGRCWLLVKWCGIEACEVFLVTWAAAVKTAQKKKTDLEQH